MDGLKYLLRLGKAPEFIAVKLVGHNSPGFTPQNNHTLSFRVAKGSSIQTLLDQFNQYRGPEAQVKVLYDSHNNALSQQSRLQDSQTLYLGAKGVR